MIELTTGVVFLMSSLYGSGHASNREVIPLSLPPLIEQARAASDEEYRSFTTSDPKEMEAFLRKEFADTPILVNIARCESNFKQFDERGHIIRGRIDKNDIGVMQINERYHGETAKKLGMNIYTVEGNIAYGKHLYERSGSAPWNASAPCWGSDLAKI